jgi:predicted dehydrogenase
MSEKKLRFAIIGLEHNHCYNHALMLDRTGAEFAAYYSDKPEQAAEFARTYPDIPRAPSLQAILDDRTIDIVGGAPAPVERARIAMQAMLHGKDVLADKPAVVSLEQLDELERVQRQTGRIWAFYSNEHHDRRCTVRAGELVAEGAIGRVVQTTGFGPHRLGALKRPPWFFRPSTSGGILGDIGAHQIEQFLSFTGSTSAEITVAQTGNFANPEHPEFEDYGEAALTGNGGVGWFRVDWYTPASIGVPGDIRLIILGTEGYIEARKYIDPAGRPGDGSGRPGTEHLLLVNEEGARFIDLSNVALKFGSRFVADIRNRTETAIPQARSFLTVRLAMQAQAMARRLSNINPPLTQGDLWSAVARWPGGPR